MRTLLRLVLLVGALGASLALVPVPAGATPTPRAECGPGSAPETGAQGRVPLSDYESGRTAQGYRCNAEQVGQSGGSGGFRVHRFVDRAGHECAYYDTSLLVGVSVVIGQDAGVAVLDMSDPAHPKRTDTLVTPAMLSPHESLNLSQARGLLVAVMGTPATAPGIVDVYDLNADCRHPQLRSSTPLGGFGHEATLSPDGRTFYVAATSLPWVVALDLTNPSLPLPIWVSTDHTFHGMNVSDDGNRLYAADVGIGRSAPGLAILDVSQVQRRVPSPAVPTVSFLTWPNVSIPQTAIPVTIGGHPYLVEIDEYSRGLGTEASAPVGAGRIIDIGDERRPSVVSELRLEVNEPANRAGSQRADPGADTAAQGYGGHYCSVPQRTDPGVVACSFIVSGLRVFDIRTPAAPKEIAYFSPPSRDVLGGGSAAVAASQVAAGLFVCQVATSGVLTAAAAPPPTPLADLIETLPTKGRTLAHWAMSAPTFVPERNEVWYSDGMYGFYAVRLTNGVWTPSTTVAPPAAATSTTAPTPTTIDDGAGARLPVTGADPAIGWAVVALALALALRRISASQA